MIYNYIPGTNETLTLQSIGQNTGVGTVIKADGYYTNIISDLVLYSDAAGTTAIPFVAYSETDEDTQVTALEVGQSDKTAYKAYIVTDPTYQNIDLWATFTNFGTYTDNQAAVDWMSESRDIYNPRQFVSGRIDSQELTSGTLSTSGWYTIAETGNQAYQAYSEDFVCSYGLNTFKFRLACYENNGTKDRDNVDIEILARGGAKASAYIKGARLAKGDGVTGGFKVQIEIFVGGGFTLNTLMSQNSGREGGVSTNQQMELVTPYLDDTPTLPDGVTPATFIEAGAELSFDGIVFDMVPNLTGFRFSNDAILCTVLWPEIPKQGTGLTLTTASTNTIFYDGDGTPIALGSFTISSFSVSGYYVRFLINQVNIGTVINTGPLALRINGTGAKLKITG